jgi:putative membrane protein
VNVLHRTRAQSAPVTAPDGSALPASADELRRVPRTRTGAAWVGICASVLTLIVLIVFMLQNTRRVQVNFLWMDGTLPLALALLIAGVGIGVVAMTIGAARMAQLRRLVHRKQSTTP